MKITTSTPSVKAEAALTLCFDVSQRTLSLYSQYDDGGRIVRLEDDIPNATPSIEHLLRRCDDLAAELGLPGLVVPCEATGGYERKLLGTARSLGHCTGLINPEHVAKFKTVESNDTGKTDHKDPRVMHLIARLGKTQTHRHLPEIYRRLRRLAAYYDDDENLLSTTRQRIQALIGELFLDYNKPVAFTFSKTGAALMDAYAFNPYAIVRAGYARFQQKMKRRVRFVHFATLEHLYKVAEGVRAPRTLSGRRRALYGTSQSTLG